MIDNFHNPATNYEAWRDAVNTEDFPDFVKLLCEIRDAINFAPQRIFDYGYGWGISQCLWLTSYEDATVTCCDPIDQGGYADSDPVAGLPQSCLDRWTFIHGMAEDVLLTDIEPFDFIFVDADHGYHSTLAQIRLSWDKLIPGGVMAGHDWHFQAVQGAVDDFMSEKMLRGQIWDTDNGGYLIRKEG